MKKIIIPLLLLFPLMANCQRKITIDSVGLRKGNNIELFSEGVCYIYHWRGLGNPKAKPGDIAYIYEPNKRFKNYYLSLIKK